MSKNARFNYKTMFNNILQSIISKQIQKNLAAKNCITLGFPLVNCIERFFGLLSATFGQIRPFSGHQFFPVKNYFLGHMATVVFTKCLQRSGYTATPVPLLILEVFANGKISSFTTMIVICAI
jgi:hypothetical protein